MPARRLKALGRFRKLAFGTVAAMAAWGALPAITSGEEIYDPAYVQTPAPGAHAGAMSLPFGMPGSYFLLRHYAGDGVPNPDSFTTFSMFLPLDRLDTPDGNEDLWFFEPRFVLQNDGQVGGNLGLGYRFYDAHTDRVWGLNFWNDVDNTHRNFFYQTGVGFESLGDIFDFRANGYIPLGEKEKAYGHSPIASTRRFGGRFILFDRDRFEEQAMTGFDLEGGVRLPGTFAREHDIRAYAGYYRYDSDGAPEFDGVSGRIEGNVTPNLLLQLIVTDDDVFDTNVIFGVSWAFSGGSNHVAGLPNSARERIAQPVYRNYNVVVTERRIYDPVPATDPVTNLPITVVHVDSSAAAGGDGSFERPFNTLTQASDPMQSEPRDIIFAHADSVFDGQAMTLQADQRFLGEGLEHFVDTVEHGLISIPRATDGTALPIIRNAPAGMGAVNLASNTEVAGFQIQNSLGAGIYGAAVGGTVSIHDNTIAGSLRGIDIRNSSGTFTIQSTPISNTTDDGILLTDNSSAANFNFVGPTQIDGPGGVGVSIQGGSSSITFEELEITNRFTSAIGIGRSAGTIAFTEPITIANPNGTLDEAIGIANTSAEITFAGVTIDDTDRLATGLPAVVFGNATGSLTFESLDITTNNGGGLMAINIATINVNDGVINAVGGPGVDVNGATDIDLTFESVSSSGSSIGISLINTGGSFLITGDGTTPGSGGTIQSTGIGVGMNTAENATFNFLDIQSATDGFFALNSNNIVLNGSTLAGSADDWLGVSIYNNGEGNDGTPVILSGNTITGTGANQIGMQIINDGSPQGSVRIDDNSIVLGTNNTFGFDIRAIDSSPNSGPGDIVLLSLQNNTVISTIGQEFIGTETNATLFGQILVNGTLRP